LLKIFSPDTPLELERVVFDMFLYTKNVLNDSRRNGQQKETADHQKKKIADWTIRRGVVSH